MNRATIHTYARVLYNVATEESELDRAFAELRDLDKILRGDSRFVPMLLNPLIPLHERVATVKKITESCLPLVRRFLMMLLRRYALGNLDVILNKVEEMRVEAAGGLVATLEVARPLGEEQVKAIAASVETLTKRKPHFTVVTNDSLIGGFKVRSESYLIDASMKGILMKLARGGVHGS